MQGRRGARIGGHSDVFPREEHTGQGRRFVAHGYGCLPSIRSAGHCWPRPPFFFLVFLFFDVYFVVYFVVAWCSVGRAGPGTIAWEQSGGASATGSDDLPLGGFYVHRRSRTSLRN